MLSFTETVENSIHVIKYGARFRICNCIKICNLKKIYGLMKLIKVALCVCLIEAEQLFDQSEV